MIVVTCFMRRWGISNAVVNAMSQHVVTRIYGCHSKPESCAPLLPLPFPFPPLPFHIPLLPFPLLGNISEPLRASAGGVVWEWCMLRNYWQVFLIGRLQGLFMDPMFFFSFSAHNWTHFSLLERIDRITRNTPCTLGTVRIPKSSTASSSAF